MSAPLRIGLIGLDTSHVVAFTQILNNPADPNHVPGGRVVAAFPGGVKDFELSWGRVEGFTKELREKHGVQMMDSPEALAEAVDLVFIEAVDGRSHLDLFKRTIKFERPTFIDKPLAVKSADAREIFRLAAQAGVPVMSSSALRYTESLKASLAKAPAQAGGGIVGCDACGPMALQPTQPGLFWYGIHTVEVVETVMGAGCKRVSAVTNADFDLVTAVWGDGRIATIRGHRKGHGRFGVTIHREQGFESIDLSAVTRPFYASMLDAIMGALPKGRSAIPTEQTLECIRLIEAANESRETGKPVEL